MSTTQLTNVRVGTDVIMSVHLMNDGVAIDWSLLTDICAYVYSDSQRVMSGRCTTVIDEEDPTLLTVTFSANNRQCLGVNRLVVSCISGASNVTYDAPAFAYVATLAEASNTTEVEAAEVNISLSVTSRTSTVIEELLAACIAATDDANEAADDATDAANTATASANSADQAATAANTAATAANTAAAAFASAIVQTTGQQTNKTMSQKAVTDALAGKANASTTYTKSEVDTALSGKANVGASYSKAESDTLLGAKANDNAVMHLAGAETITGGKTFTEIVNFEDPVNADLINVNQLTADDGMTISPEGSLILTATGDLQISAEGVVKVVSDGGTYDDLVVTLNTFGQDISSNRGDINTLITDMEGKASQSDLDALSEVVGNVNDLLATI